MNKSENGIIKQGKQTGSAIILVLGMLAVLLIMAAAFSVNMRVERTGSGNYKYAVSTRHLLLAALANAIDDIDNSIINGTNSIIFPPWDILSSTGGSDSATLVWGEALTYIPAVLTSNAQNIACQWLPINTNKHTGRYAYVIINASHFIDANNAGGAPRMRGADCTELQLAALSDVDDVTNFLANRVADVRYEDLSEFGELQYEGMGLITNEPWSFVTYSRYPYGVLDSSTNIVNNFVTVQGDKATLLANQAAIGAAFYRSGAFSSLDLARLKVNLFDFVDGDRLPGNANGAYNPAVGPYGPYVEAFPMFNEVFVSNRLIIATNAAGLNCRGAYWFKFECTYPFLYPTNPTGYTFECSVTITNSAGLDLTTSADGTVAFPLQNITVNSNYWTWTLNPIGFSPKPMDMVSNVIIGVEIDAKVKDSSGNVVDAIKTTRPLKVMFNIDLSSSIPTNSATTIVINNVAVRECIDPRRNWEGGTGFWTAESTTNTIGSVNNAAISFWATNAVSDGDMWMYVKDAELETVGELGSLYFGKPWETIRLYKHGTNALHTVLDNFKIEAQTSVRPRKGLINLNTHSPDVLMSVFTNMPIREYNTSNPQRMTNQADLVNIADFIRSVSPGCYTNLADMGNVDWAAATASMSLPGTPSFCEIDRESFIRNSAGMFGTRQNLFIIILSAGPFRFMPGIASYRGAWLGRSRAVAVVWRDPFPDADGRHPCFVRMFKTLSDE